MSDSVSFMAKCLDCAKPETPWSFDSYEMRAEWVGTHRVSTGHKVEQWISGGGK